MTKYVLNSGFRQSHPLHELKRKFHRELVKDLGSHPKFVICSFAEGREYWNIRFKGYAGTIAEDMPNGVSPSFELAVPDNLEDQCAAADVIYFNSGDDVLLKYWMSQFDLTKLFEGKVVATGSASSDVLAAQFWSSDWRKCLDGLGILPIKFIPHYLANFGDADPRGPVNWQQAHDKLEKYDDTSLPIYALKEGEYEVFER